MTSNVLTSFRAYQLGSIGSSFSYASPARFVLGEGRLNPLNGEGVVKELELFSRESIDELHITSWDADHCSPDELRDILRYLNPKFVDAPGYDPDSVTAKECLSVLREYCGRPGISGHSITSDFINTLDFAEPWKTNSIFYRRPRQFEDHNNNSTMKLFRFGAFSVLSLGDVESPEIAAGLIADPILRNEVDVLILAHHGADNGFTTEDFIASISPTVAICTSNYDNQFEHPREEIRAILNNCGVKLLTTKTGDVVIRSSGHDHSSFVVTNLIANSTKISSQYSFLAKRP